MPGRRSSPTGVRRIRRTPRPPEGAMRHIAYRNVGCGQSSPPRSRVRAGNPSRRRKAAARRADSEPTSRLFARAACRASQRDPRSSTQLATGEPPNRPGRLAPVTDIEIGRAKPARRAYAFDDIAIVPSRRTRDPQDVSVTWTIDAFTFEIPVLAAPMDSVVSPETAIAIGKLGGLGVLDLEGVWTRYEEPDPLVAEFRVLPVGAATARMQEIYADPIKPELVTDRLAQI